MNERERMMQQAKYFDGLFIGLRCGHKVWKGTLEFDGWATGWEDHTFDFDRPIRCIKCEEDQSE